MDGGWKLIEVRPSVELACGTATTQAASGRPSSWSWATGTATRPLSRSNRCSPGRSSWRWNGQAGGPEPQWRRLCSNSMSPWPLRASGPPGPEARGPSRGFLVPPLDTDLPPKSSQFSLGRPTTHRVAKKSVKQLLSNKRLTVGSTSFRC